MKNLEIFDKDGKALHTAAVIPRFVFCARCGSPVKLTKDGRYMKHGHRFSIANKTYLGLPCSQTRIEVSPPCMNSGEKYVPPKNEV